MGKLKALIGVVVVLVIAYLAGAPYITVYQMKLAAQRHDGEALSAHIDFPNLRQGLKDQANAAFSKKMAEHGVTENSPLASIGAAVGGVVANKMVDTYATPEGIAQLMAGKKPGTEEDDDGGDEGDEADDGHTGHVERKPFSSPSMSYVSFNEFIAKVKGEGGQDIRFVLQRRGIDWKLTNIIIPAE